MNDALLAEPLNTAITATPSRHRWNPASVALIVLAWLILHIGGLFSPGLLDDVDSVYIEIAREMLQRHDFVTPYVDGIRFFDKPPLMYWLAAGSMHLFGIHAWAARLPLALLTLALFLAIYALGLRLFAEISPASHPDRAALYAALAFATALGPYLYTRFFIPDILIALWMTLGVHLFLIALDRISHPSRISPDHLSPQRLTQGKTHSATPASAVILRSNATKNPERSRTAAIARTFQPQSRVPHPLAVLSRKGGVGSATKSSRSTIPGTLLPTLAFAAVMALNVLSKGLIGLIFPLAFVLLYLALTHQLRVLKRLHPMAATATFLAFAAPWHILAALRNPAIPLPPGLGLPAHGGWAWFYLYNEHIARFLSRRIPHDYGQLPIPLFWLLAIVWLLPWAAFLPGALAQHIRNLRTPDPGVTNPGAPPSRSLMQNGVPASHAGRAGKGGVVFRRVLPTHAPRTFPQADLTLSNTTPRQREAALTLLLWPALVLGFFTLSARQEYYSLPALPALALIAGGLLAHADRNLTPEDQAAHRSANRWSLWILVPFGILTAAAAGFFAIAAPHPAPSADISTHLSQASDAYNLSLGHIYDLTGPAMGLFRAPLAACALCMLAIGPGAWLIRRQGHTFAANLTLAAAATGLLLCVHEGLARFYPILGSKPLADAIVAEQHLHPQPPNSSSADLILIDGELTSGSTLLFYTGQPVHLVEGRMNGPWYGSFWPDAPAIFETEATLRTLWSSPHRIFLLTNHPTTRTHDLIPAAPVRTLASTGGKSILTNRP